MLFIYFDAIHRILLMPFIKRFDAIHRNLRTPRLRPKQTRRPDPHHEKHTGRPANCSRRLIERVLRSHITAPSDFESDRSASSSVGQKAVAEIAPAWPMDCC